MKKHTLRRFFAALPPALPLVPLLALLLAVGLAVPPMPAGARAVPADPASQPSSQVSQASPVSGRPEEWAQTLPGFHINNLHRITPTLYRSAQPAAKDISELQKLGIRKIVSFREFHSDEETLAGAGITLERIPMNAWDIDDKDMVAALRALRDTERDGPVLIHCLHGADRTGIVSALYRMVFEGWSRQRAIEELRHGGYGFHPIWVNIVHYLERVDVEKLRREVGIAGVPAAGQDSPAVRQ